MMENKTKIDLKNKSMDENKFEGVTKINNHEFELHNARCFKIDVPQIGPAQAIYYDVVALKTCCESRALAFLLRMEASIRECLT